MTSKEKALERVRKIPKDYTFHEAEHILKMIGFEEIKTGKTSGSRRKYFRKSDGRVFICHKPHPDNVMKPIATRKFYEFLERIGTFDE